MDTSLSRANKLIVTTSWDDGDVLDVRLADLLTRYGIRGTFYITKEYRPERLSDEQIRSIAGAHEIGTHTLTHPDLRFLSEEEAGKEILGGKQWLEELLSSEVSMFCYPRGHYNAAISSAVKEAGFRGARTTELGSIALPSNPFDLKTTIQIYPFPLRKLNKDQYCWGRLLEPYRQRATGLRALGVSTFAMRSWLSTARATFDAALTKGDVFHLWGHSWEIEKYGMWEELGIVLQYVANRKDCVYSTNKEVLESMSIADDSISK